MASATFEYADLIGKPFKWGGRGPDYYDCYGLVEEMSRRIGRKVPDYTSPTVHQHIADLIEQQVSYWTPCEAEPGAVATIRIMVPYEGRMRQLVSHVGMVLPHGKLIHAWQKANGVAVERIAEWERRITGYYRFQ